MVRIVERCGGLSSLRAGRYSGSSVDLSAVHSFEERSDYASRFCDFQRRRSHNLLH